MDMEIFHLLAFSGLRSGELCALKDTDFFFETNELRVTKTLYSPKNNKKGYKLTPPKTKRSIRKFDVIENVMRGIESHIERMRSQRLIYKKNLMIIMISILFFLMLMDILLSLKIYLNG